MSASAALPGIAPTTAFAGSPRQARVLGRLYVFAGYGVTFALLAYVVTFAASLMVLFIRGVCAARAAAPFDSLLFAAGRSPVCDDGVPGQLLALLPPVLELAAALWLIRGPPRVGGRPLIPPVEATVRAVFTPLMPRIAALRLSQWPNGTMITPDGILFGPLLVREFQDWTSGIAPNPARLMARYAIFTTLHELGHLTLGDTLYSRASDRAIPAVGGFMALLMLVAMPAGQWADGYWLSVILTGLECVAAVLATRYALSRVMTNFEFLMDNFAAAHASGLTGGRQTLPGFSHEETKFRLRRSHPTLAARREYLRSMRCGGFFTAYLLALPVVALAEAASTSARDTMASIQALQTLNDLLAAASLCVLGVFAGAAAARSGFARAWWCYGGLVAVVAALILAATVLGVPAPLADTAYRLSFRGRIVLWGLVLAAPLAGLAARWGTDWFDCGPNAIPPAQPPSTIHSAPAPKDPSAPLFGRLIRYGGAAFSRVALAFFRGFVFFAAAEAAVFGFIVIVFVVDTGIFDWVPLVCFLIYFAVPFSHALRPAWRLPLVLDQLFQMFFLSMTVVVMGMLPFLVGPDGPLRMAEIDALLNDPRFLARGHEMFRDALWLCILLPIVGGLRLAGQRLERRRIQESNDGNA
jgi:hypothetical protein